MASSGCGSASGSRGGFVRTDSAVQRAMMRGGVCYCGDKLAYFTSHTRSNPDRNLWRCRKWQTPSDCGFFFWDDDDVLVLQRELEQSKKELEESQKELEDYKRKLDDMKRENGSLARMVQSEVKNKNIGRGFIITLSLCLRLIPLIMVICPVFLISSTLTASSSTLTASSSTLIASSSTLTASSSTLIASSSTSTLIASSSTSTRTASILTLTVLPQPFDLHPHWTYTTQAPYH